MNNESEKKSISVVDQESQEEVVRVGPLNEAEYGAQRT